MQIPAEYPPNVREALRILGNCEHTVEPWKACDTCGRPISEFMLRAGDEVAAFAWQAQTVDGITFEKKDVGSVDNLPLDKVAVFSALTSSPRAPLITCIVDPRKGERLRAFTMHELRSGIRSPLGDPAAPAMRATKTSVYVVEITPDPAKPDQFVRLYVGPTGLVLSTKERHFR